MCGLGQGGDEVLVRLSHHDVGEVIAGLVEAQPPRHVHQPPQLVQLLRRQPAQIQLQTQNKSVVIAHFKMSTLSTLTLCINVIAGLTSSRETRQL